jgi:hypothetical protein
MPRSSDAARVHPAPHATRPVRGAAAWLSWLVALGGFGFDLATFWPGQMSHDSALAWWQARGGPGSDIVPPLFVAAWRACDAVLPGPGLLFALHSALFWSGLALLARGLRLRQPAAIALLLVAGFAPVTLLLRAHAWTDVGLFSALACATGVLACVQSGARRGWLLPAFALLCYAGGMRHNALPALLPLLAWLAWLAGRGALRPSHVTLLAVILGAGVLGVVRLGGLGVARHVPMWPSLAQWDLAALSVSSGTLLLPDFMVGPGMDVGELSRAFRPWSNTPMLVGTRHGMRAPFDAFSPEELSALRSAWITAIRQDPAGWLAHRWRLSRALFGTHRREWPAELLYVDAIVPYRDNPPLSPNRSPWHRAVMRAADALRGTALLAAWPALAAGLLAAPLAWRRRRLAAGCTALLLLASAWLYALPLALLAPAAELRYLGWPCVASLAAFVIALAGARAGARLANP